MVAAFLAAAWNRRLTSAFNGVLIIRQATGREVFDVRPAGIPEAGGAHFQSPYSPGLPLSDDMTILADS